MENTNNYRVPPMCLTSGVNTSQNIPNGSFTPIEFTGADDVDTDSIHNPASNPSRFTVATAGVYVITFTLVINSTAVAGAVLAITKNGGAFAENGSGSPISASAVRMTVTAMTNCAVGDYIEGSCYQASSPSGNRQPYGGRMSVAWLGQVS